MAKGKLIKKAKEKAKKAKEKAKKGLSGLFDNMKHAAATVGAPALLPFKGMMIKALVQKGVPVSKKDKINKIAVLFYDKIIVKKQHLNYEEYDALNYEHLGEDAAVALGAGVINSIIDYIQGLREKRAKGEKLSPDEEQILNGAEKASQAIDSATEKAAKNWFAELWWLWLLIIAALVFMAVKKKKSA